MNYTFKYPIITDTYQLKYLRCLCIIDMLVIYCAFLIQNIKLNYSECSEILALVTLLFISFIHDFDISLSAEINKTNKNNWHVLTLWVYLHVQHWLMGQLKVMEKQLSYILGASCTLSLPHLFRNTTQNQYQNTTICGTKNAPLIMCFAH